MRRPALLVLAVLLSLGAELGAPTVTWATTSQHGVPVALRGSQLTPRSATTSAAAFAQQVLAEAPLPPGSEPTSSVPRLLDQAMQRPGTAGLIDLDRVYATPVAPEQVEAEVLAHLPKGAKRTETGTFGGPGGSGRGFVVTLSTSGANEYLAQLVYSLVASGSGSIVRVDAQSVWEPDKTATTISGAATGELTGFVALSLARPSSGAVTVHLGATASARIAAALNALPVAPQADCMEESTWYTIVLHADGGAQFQVTGLECSATVEMSRNGQQLAPLHDAACSVLRLVGTYLPRRASGTRLAASGCGTGG